MNSFSQLKERCNKHCGNCFYEELNANEEPCLSCSIPKRFDNWKPREPKVLSAEEIATETFSEKFKGRNMGYPMASLTLDDLTSFANICRGNFRRERDQELKPVIERYKEAIRYFENVDLYTVAEEMEELLKNIPSLEE